MDTMEQLISQVEAANQGAEEEMQPVEGAPDPKPEDDVDPNINDEAEDDLEGSDGEDDEGGDDEADEGDEPEGGKRRRSKPAKDRIAELTAFGREQERRANELEERLKKLESAKETAPEPEPVEPTAPNPDDFEYGESDPAYLEARQDYKLDLRDYKAALADREVRKEAAERQSQDDQVAAVRERFQQGVMKAQADGRAKYNDFDAKVEAASSRPLPALAGVAISVSPVGGDLIYRLATDAEATAKLAALADKPQNLAAAIGALEAEYTEDDTDLDMSDQIDMARLVGRLQARQRGVKLRNEVVVDPTDAPEPPKKRIKGSAGGKEVSPDTEDTKAFMRVYGKGVGL